MNYLSKGIEAYKRNDFENFVVNLEKAVALAPNNPDLMYTLARAHALLDNRLDSMKWLNKSVRSGFYFNTKSSSFDELEHNDLKLLKGSSDFEALLRKIDRLNIPIHNSVEAFNIPEKDLFPEGIAYDPVSDKFYIGSIHKRKIVSVDSKRKTEEFVSEKQDGIGGIGGIKIDAARRVLWATHAFLPIMKDFDAKNFGMTGVLKFNLTDAGLIKKYLLDERPISHLFNDLAVSSKGDVYITDSHYNAVYRITADSDRIELFIKPKRFTYPNGITFSSDEKFLFVSHLEGISRIRIKSRSCSLLSHSSDIALSGTDGLYFFEKSLIAVQGNFRPSRVVQFFLSKNFRKVLSFKILESNNPLLQQPTTGVLLNNDLYYISNSQLDLIFPKNSASQENILSEIIILKVRLETNSDDS